MARPGVSCLGGGAGQEPEPLSSRRKVPALQGFHGAGDSPENRAHSFSNSVSTQEVSGRDRNAELT